MEQSNLQKILDSGTFSVTAEIGPPISADADLVRKHARELRGAIDAANVTDNQTAIVRMSSVAASALALQEGVEPVLQVTCRDRNRIAIQSDLLGAHALGIRNVLSLSGDHQSFGNHPQSKNVYDIDSIQLIGLMKKMNQEQQLLSGTPLKAPVNFFIGATANPFADPAELQMIRLHKKIRAGAQFIQTQAIYDIEKFDRWMEKVRSEGLDKQAHMLAGIVVNKSLKSIEMTALVAGMDVPQSLIERMRAAEKRDEEGIAIAVDLINQIRTIKGVAGIHIMAIGWESVVPILVERAGLTNRPSAVR